MPTLSNLLLYPYLQELMAQYPYETRKLGYPGHFEGSRYDKVSRPRKVVIDPAEMLPGTLEHEYSHYAIESNPNWSYILPTTIGERLNQPREWLHTIMDFMGYSPRIRVEEGLIKSLFPEAGVAEKLVEKPTTYFSPEQLELLPYLQKHLQYGPTWGSIWGEYPGKGQDIISSQGLPIGLEQLLR